MFGPELGKMRVDEWHADAARYRRRRRRDRERPGWWRRTLGAALIGLGARLGRVCVDTAPRVVERTRA